MNLSLSHWYPGSGVVRVRCGLGQLWYLIVTIPDLCNFTDFYLYKVCE